MRRYFWRQVSTLWFDRYLIFCGVLLNGLAVFGLITTLVPDGEKAMKRKFTRARVELENGPLCDHLMAASKFSPGQEIPLRLNDGTTLNVQYADKGIYTRDRSGQSIHMVEMDHVGFSFFQIDDHKVIQRCVPESLLNCVSANGSFEGDGACILAVNLDSDCTLMKGKLLEGRRCKVASNGLILKPSSGATGKVCSSPDCAQ